MSAWRDTLTLETMAKERANPPFDVRSLSIAMHGNEQSLVQKERFMLELSRDPVFYMGDWQDLTKDQLRERTMQKIAALVHYVMNETVDVFTKRMELIGMHDPGFWTRFGVHYGLFLGAIRGSATANQFSYWMEKGCISCQGMYGCFGMTELAHGSNVAGLETTATFDEKTDQFVIHTPNLGATKWWIGGAAQSATHCAVFAQLYVKGKRYGTKTFMVPLRDPKSYQLLPGINIGDIGKKMGRDGIDNGFIQFTNVRIPRAYMLMKHTQVTRDGEVREPPLQQLTYGALLQGRTAMVADAANTAKKALTIAVRYAAVRRQFKASPEAELETQILDYPIHQRRLMPLLAQATAFGFTALEMTRLFEETATALEALEPGDPNLEKTIEMLKETHATSAGLKAFCTWATLEAIDKCRQACGGHGYSSYNGFPSMYADFAVHCTWEGDNTILALQSGRALISSYLDAKHKGKKLAAATSYMNDIEKVLAAKCAGESELSTLSGIEAGWATVAAHAVKKAAEDFEALVNSGKSRDQAFEACSQVRFVAASIHSSGYIFRQFKQAVERLDDAGDGVRKNLELVSKLYGLWQMEEKAAFFLRSGWLSAAQLDLVQKLVSEYCYELRKIAIPLIDAFALSDHIVNSPIGVKSGDIYREYFRAVRRANPQNKEHPYFERVIKPFIFRSPPELEDFDEIGVDEDIEEIREELEEAEKERIEAEKERAAAAKKATVE
ncbi:fatty-acyl coenzyme A oxidase [Tilletia horrida]|uniref:Acyl-coenzyme A oxidase n=1 Tax=Tilletia horrida TaxID=155126 RepID=A0AAN6G9N9_9BASI|nr:fatty-acyl coenzyme A oxidase [Tilletia horrida]KAK0530331.1 fatty-acyl coenzyme A oxidase [Tilletia horrida]KAK0531016.1 fatty-acyl coenzyme A oxidase [Tilletia horrida]KAK0565722.1 fatty-acyl coenzyme A oxidase [Tilletia horrida]